MQDLRLILIILGAIGIIALLLHGVWTNRKEQATIFRDCPIKRLQQEQKDREKDLLSASNHTVSEVLVADITKQHPKDVSRIDESALSPNPSTYTAHIGDDHERGVGSNTTLTQPPSKPTVPTNNDERIALVLQVKEKKTVLVIHVAAYNNSVLDGQSLMKSVLQAGFKFGQMNVFHHHLNPIGTGPVLFSLTNMIEPGSFNSDKIADLITPGISIFMMIPAYGDAYQNFKRMLQSAQRIADDCGGVVLDDKHHLMTPQKLDEYKMRIRQALAANT
ncbi:Cell division protein ZipA [Candidatus Steffania adelgidicola]|nr:Cell division protein ZipA [Candidatus Steffania adelgidicola]